MGIRTHAGQIMLPWRFPACRIDPRSVMLGYRRRCPLFIDYFGDAWLHERPFFFDFRQPSSALDQKRLTEFELDPLPLKLAIYQHPLPFQAASTPQPSNRQATVFRAGQRICARFRRRPVQEVGILKIPGTFASRNFRQSLGFGANHRVVKHIHRWIDVRGGAKNCACHRRDRVGVGTDRIRRNSHRFRRTGFAPGQAERGHRCQHPAAPASRVAKLQCVRDGFVTIVATRTDPARSNEVDGLPDFVHCLRPGFVEVPRFLLEGDSPVSQLGIARDDFRQAVGSPGDFPEIVG